MAIMAITVYAQGAYNNNLFIMYGDSWVWGNSKRLLCYYSLTLNIYYIYKFINV